MKSIAIVDDDIIQQLTLKKMIDVSNIVDKTYALLNGSELLDYLIKNSKNANELPDIILLDINMPVMTGFEFLNHFDEIKEVLVKKIAIYILSSSIDYNDVEKAKNNTHISDYISKPLTMENLIRIAEETFN